MKIRISNEFADQVCTRLGEEFPVDAIEVDNGLWSFFVRKHPADLCPMKVPERHVQVTEATLPSSWRLSGSGSTWKLGPSCWVGEADFLNRLYEGEQTAVDAYCRAVELLDEEA